MHTFLLHVIFCITIFTILVRAQLSDYVTIATNASEGWVASGPEGRIYVVYRGRMPEQPFFTGILQSGMSIDDMRTYHTWAANAVNRPKIDVAPDGVPHIAYQVGTFSNATSCYYTRLSGSTMIPAEKFADASELSAERAYVPDVCAVSGGNALVCFWSGDAANSSGMGRAFYRWRSATGEWSAYQGNLSTYHAATPKVEEHNGSFYLCYAASDFNKRISGPKAFNAPFDAGIRMVSDISSSYQNEGTTFVISSAGKFAGAGNARMTADGGQIGVWATDNVSGSWQPQLLGTWEGERGAESSYHPDVAFDEETGDIYVCVWAAGDNLAWYAVKRNGSWSSFQRLVPELGGAQGVIRAGPSLADIPGPGVVALINVDGNLLLRTIGVTETAAAPSQRITQPLYVLPQSDMSAFDMAGRLAGSNARLRGHRLLVSTAHAGDIIISPNGGR